MTAMLERVCECGSRLTARQRVCCSRACSSRRNAAITHALFPQRGAANFNFKGWRSKRPAVYTRRFKRANPEKVRAHRIVAASLRARIIARPEHCECCGRATRIDAHHHDYAQPLVVQWLCRKCHAARDKVRREIVQLAVSR